MPLDIELIKDWIDALESGKYAQGRGVLRTKDDRFCCLGVLCALTPAGVWSLTPDDVWDTATRDDVYVYAKDEEEKNNVSTAIAFVTLSIASKLGGYTRVGITYKEPEPRVDVLLSVPPWLVSKFLEEYYRKLKEQNEYEYDEDGTFGPVAEEEDLFGDINDYMREGSEVHIEATKLNDNMGLTFKEIAECVRYTFRSFL